MPTFQHGDQKPQMIEGHSVIWQALEGTLFTWFVTALGAGMVYLIPSLKRGVEAKLLDASLGFAAGDTLFVFCLPPLC